VAVDGGGIHLKEGHVRFAARAHVRGRGWVVWCVRCWWRRLRDGNVDMLTVVEQDGNVWEFGGIASAEAGGWDWCFLFWRGRGGQGLTMHL